MDQEEAAAKYKYLELFLTDPLSDVPPPSCSGTGVRLAAGPSLLAGPNDNSPLSSVGVCFIVYVELTKRSMVHHDQRKRDSYR